VDQEKEKASREEKVLWWRRYARKHLVPPEPSSSGIRVGVRLPNGGRGVRMFAPTDKVNALYVFAESLLVPTSEDMDSDPDQPPAGYVHDWSLRLVTSYPRKEITHHEATLGSIGELKGGANLVAEMISSSVEFDAESDSDTEDNEE